MSSGLSLQIPIITKVSDLIALARTLAQEPVIAVDTESNSLYAYREQVCLIQFSTPQADYLVDPLTLPDLTPLSPVFADPNIEKIFHAAEYDLICLRRDFDFYFANLFDTMVAARILGRKEVGLGSVLQAEFGVALDKRYQRANWGLRPLPPDLLDYARMDTHYLIQLRQCLYSELEERGLWPLAMEDFARLCYLNGRYTPPEQSQCWQISRAHDLTPQQIAVLRELCTYRDQVARSLNRPLFKVISDATLVSIAAACPATPHELGRLPGMTQGQVRRHGKAILQAVQRGLHADPVRPPRPAARPNEQFLNRLEALRRWRKETARHVGVESDVVLSRDLLYELAERNPVQPEDLAKVLGEVPFRLQHYGPQILDILKRC